MEDLSIKGGVLTVNHPKSDGKQPVFLYEGAAYGPTALWPGREGAFSTPKGVGARPVISASQVWQVLEDEAATMSQRPDILRRFVEIGKINNGLA